MKLAVISAKRRLKELFPFRTLKEGNRWLVGLEEQELPTAELMLFESFSKAIWGLSPPASLHIAKDRMILHLKDRLPSSWRMQLRGFTCYHYQSDLEASDWGQGLRLNQIAHLSQFYQDHNEDKILVSTNWELVESLLTQAPLSYIHLFLAEKSWHLAVGERLYPDAKEPFGFALDAAEDLAQSCAENSLLPFREVREFLAKKQGSSYGFFARRYDEYMSHVKYDRWYVLLRKWFATFSKRDLHKVLEIACGTASLATIFVKNGYEVHASDLSEEMLYIASQKEHSPILFQASMTDPIPLREQDLIYCIFDSINYLLRFEEITLCLKEVYKALAPGGLFIFDISTLQNSAENFDEMVTLNREKDSLLIHEAYYEPWNQKQISKLDLFERWAEGYQRQSEHHRQKVYMTDELISLIEETEFKLKAIYGLLGRENLYPKKLNDIDHKHDRIYFVLKKDESAL